MKIYLLGTLASRGRYLQNHKILTTFIFLLSCYILPSVPAHATKEPITSCNQPNMEISPGDLIKCSLTTVGQTDTYSGNYLNLIQVAHISSVREMRFKE